MSKALDTEDDGAVVDLKKAVQKVKDWLATTGMRISRVYTQVQLNVHVLTDRKVETWLLVFDNFNAVADIQEYLPTSGTGSVIITTRDMVIADGLNHWTKTVRLEGLQRNDAKTLLRQINPGIPQSNLTDNIIDELEACPWPSPSWGNYIQQTMCSLDDFKIILQSPSERLYSDKASMPTVRTGRQIPSPRAATYPSSSYPRTPNTYLACSPSSTQTLCEKSSSQRGAPEFLV